MKAKLISREHGEFEIGAEATIGRSAESTVCIQASVVSTEHARIAFDTDSERYLIEDLGSLNGTEVDGVRLERPEPIGPLSMVCFGGSERFIFQALDTEGGEFDTIDIPPVDKTQTDGEIPILPAALRDDGAEEKRSDDELAEKKPAASKELADDGGTRVEKVVVPIPEILAEASASASRPAQPGAPGRRLFLELQMAGRVQRFQLDEGENLVGRTKDARVRLNVPDVSRRHAVVTVTGDKVLVRDEGSRNHTFVAGAQTEGEVELPVGERVVFGRLEGRLVEEG